MKINGWITMIFNACFISISLVSLTSSSFSQEAQSSKKSIVVNPCEDSLLVELELKYSHNPDSLSYEENKQLYDLQKDCDEFTEREREYEEGQRDYRDIRTNP